MKTPILLVTALLFASASVAAAATTDRQALQKRVAKVAPPDNAKGKLLCACSFGSGAGFQNRVGFLRQQVLNDQVFVFCAGDIFDADGNDVGGFSCRDFYPLGK